MGAKISRFTDSINKRRRRSSRSGDDVITRNVQSNGSLETGHDPAVHGASLEDRNYNNESFKKRDLDPSDPQQNAAATKIQTQYRQHSAKEEVTEMKEELAATRIQAGFRGFLDREQVREMKTKSEEGDDAAKDEEEVDIDLEDPDVEKAAIKIQAGFKGFKARKEVQEKSVRSQDEPGEEEAKNSEKIEQEIRAEEGEKTKKQNESEEVKKKKKEEEEEEEEVDIDLEDPEVGKAALKIQAGFKGLKARKQIAMKKTENTETNKGNSSSRSESKAESVEEKNKNNDSGIVDELADIDLKDPDLAKVTLKLQAGFRGFKSRKKTKEEKPTGNETLDNSCSSNSNNNSSSSSSSTGSSRTASGMTGEEATKAKPKPELSDELKDIDLKDPELGKAALKIQAGFKRRAKSPVVKECAAQPSPQPEEKAAEEPEPKPSKPEEEEVDIDLNDPEVKKAAVKIQAGFKGLKARQSVVKQQKEQQDATQAETTQQEESTENKTEQPQEEEIDIDLEDPATEKAALKIQAGFRGYQTRKDLSQPDADAPASEAKPEESGDAKEESAAPEAEAAPEQAKAEEEEEIDIDLNDPEVEKAATKIQAGFKGLKTRKQVQQMKAEKVEGQTGEDQVDAVPASVQEATMDGVAAVEEDVGEAEGEGGDGPAETAPEEKKEEQPAAEETKGEGGN